MEGLGINPWILLAQIVNFVILVVLLRLVAYKPIQKMLKERQERIQKGLDDAAAAEKERAEIATERNAVLSQARAEAERTLAEAAKGGREEAERLLAEARQEAERIRASAKQESEYEHTRVMGQMRGEIAALAIAAAHRLVGDTLDEQRQRALVESFFSGIREGRVEVLPADIGRTTGAATVTSAVPLTPAEEATIRQELAARKWSGDISFQVDSSILGGLVIRAGDRVVDASVAGQLEQLRQTLA